MGAGDVKEVQDIDVPAYMRIMAEVDAMRRLGTDVDNELNIDALKQEVRGKLKATYTQMGAVVDDAKLDAAVDDYFSRRHEFREPPKSFSTTLARAYVNRGKIALYAGLPTLIVAGLGLGGWGAVKAANSARLHGEESRVEQSVEQAYRSRQGLEGRLHELAGSPYASQLPKLEHEELARIETGAGDRLKGTDAFFAKYCDNGTADDNVTTSNYAEAERLLAAITSELATAESGIAGGAAIIDKQRDITGTRKDLDALIADIRATRPPPPKTLMDRAETAYKGGSASLDGRKLDEGRKYQRELGALRDDIRAFVTLPPELERAYTAVKAIAVEDAARQDGEALHKQGLQYVDTANVPQLRETISKLDNLEAVLGQEYTLAVTGGVWRYPNNNPNAKNHYLVVEARDRSGSLVSLDVRNEETGQTERVAKWGERIPQAVYERVGRDKKDNGIIDDPENTSFGRKRKGFKSVEVTIQENGRTLPRIGQITRWK